MGEVLGCIIKKKKKQYLFSSDAKIDSSFFVCFFIRWFPPFFILLVCLFVPSGCRGRSGRGTATEGAAGDPVGQ